MTIDLESVRHLEALARIELTPDERASLVDQLEQIVRYFQKIHAVDPGGTPSSGAHADPVVRDDEARPGLDRDEILRHAPDAAGGFFRVPPVIQREEE